MIERRNVVVPIEGCLRLYCLTFQLSSHSAFIRLRSLRLRLTWQTLLHRLPCIPTPGARLGCFHRTMGVPYAPPPGCRRVSREFRVRAAGRTPDAEG